MARGRHRQRSRISNSGLSHRAATHRHRAQHQGIEGAAAVGAQTARRSGADLIVMGSHGRTGVARVLLGSVASKVLMLSAVPVMIVP
jgi:nucleotide-binding universal stress UspA family protein